MLLLWLVFLVKLVVGAGLPSSLNSLSLEELQRLEGDPSVTEIVTFKIKHRFANDDKDIGELKLALFGRVAPMTVNNFIELSKGTYGFGYKNSLFHRVISNFMIQGGDFKDGTGTGGYSIYNDFGKFDDEDFSVSHNKIGRLSMANSGPNTNGAQFFITHNEHLTYLNGKHVIFGQLIDGFKVLDYIANAECGPQDKPLHDIYIADTEVISLANVDPGAYDTPAEVYDYSIFYKWLMILLFFSIVAFFVRNWYFKRQLVRDLKENSLYND